ncbi:Hypothetical_protein [Hexamita inflata]|uniref:Hypothetical_protein n=1 Tax=Hexamita inflata TaxID=28002 RepID=A0ABP1HNY0_9EUKA
MLFSQCCLKKSLSKYRPPPSSIGAIQARLVERAPKQKQLASQITRRSGRGARLLNFANSADKEQMAAGCCNPRHCADVTIFVLRTQVNVFRPWLYALKYLCLHETRRTPALALVRPVPTSELTASLNWRAKSFARRFRGVRKCSRLRSQIETREPERRPVTEVSAGFRLLG